jgi:RNA polymerase sigma-70 factor (ECF subfamily)
MTNFSDKHFVERFRNGDSGAIAAIVDAYLSHILNAARAVGLDETQAQDVVQNTFTTLIEKAPQFEGRSHIRTWLFGIFYRKVAEARRGLEKDRRFDDIDEVVEGRFAPNGSWSKPPQPMAVYGAELNRFLEECLEDVPLNQRMAFVFREVQDLSAEEICKILEVSRTNLSVLLFRARNRLRECFESKGVKRT